MSTIKQISKLRQDFTNILTVFNAVRQLPPKLVADRIRPMIRQAYDNVHEMNATKLPLESRSPYIMALSLNATHFGLGEEAAMKKAVYAINVDKSTFNHTKHPTSPTRNAIAGCWSSAKKTRMHPSCSPHLGPPKLFQRCAKPRTTTNKVVTKPYIVRL